MKSVQAGPRHYSITPLPRLLESAEEMRRTSGHRGLDRLVRLCTQPWLICLVVGVAALTFGVRLFLTMQARFPWDFAIDWTAAVGMVSGTSLYDRPEHATLSRALIAGRPDELFGNEFANFTHLPPVALLYLPLISLPFWAAIAVYRVVLAAVLTLAIVIAGFSLPPIDRKRGWLLGALGLLTLNAVDVSIALGQVDAWILLALATATWAASRQHWGRVGIAVSAAALLKISPAILLGYCLVRRRWRPLIFSGVTVLGLVSLAALLGRPSDVVDWVTREAPRLASWGLNAENKSLPGTLARVVLAQTPFPVEDAGLGHFRFLAPVLGVALLAVVWFRARCRSPRPLDLAVLVLAALLVGPITWDHYAAWSIVFLVQLADRRLWIAQSPTVVWWLLGALAVGAACLVLPYDQFIARLFDAAPRFPSVILRLGTGVNTLGILLWFGVGVVLLRPTSRSA